MSQEVETVNQLLAKLDFGMKRPEFYHKIDRSNLKVNAESTPIRDFVKPHIDSYNYMMSIGLRDAVKRLPSLEFELPEDSGRLSLSVLDIELFKPSRAFADDKRLIYPNECRLARTTYRGRVEIKVCCKLNDQVILIFNRNIGSCPIMVQSKLCNLNEASEKKLVEHGEEAKEGGGYFIVNGNEKILRLLIGQRRNYAAFVSRSSWQKIGPGYTEHGLIIRCVPRSQLPTDNFLHYIEDGTCSISMFVEGRQFYVPFIIVIKALTERSDYAIMNDASTDDQQLNQSLRTMMQRLVTENIRTPQEALSFLGSWFRESLGVGKWWTDEESGKFLINRCLFTHLDEWESKYHFGLFCIKKLFLGVQRTPAVCRPDPIDTTALHELITPGQVVASVIIEKVVAYLKVLRTRIFKSFSKSLLKTHDIKRACEEVLCRIEGELMTAAFENFFATGNLPSRTNPFSANQNVGWVIMAERINFLRYIAHFRSVHRGAPFTTTRISSVRRLCPESFGFMCPVNTPDGSLCGLLNHLTMNCSVTCDEPDTDDFVCFMKEHGLIERHLSAQIDRSQFYDVLLNGDLIGYLSVQAAPNFIQFMRECKAKGASRVPQCTEFGLVEDPSKIQSSSQTRHYSLCPGLFISTSFGRMVRPVFNLAAQSIEYISPFEQVFKAKKKQ